MPEEDAERGMGGHLNPTVGETVAVLEKGVEGEEGRSFVSTSADHTEE